ncbi:MAG: hypothetical protein JKY52_15565 [Flavobacteriales bacterium]|nr:hypothetical protein [Flavobacteriales bacterium]
MDLLSKSFHPKTSGSLRHYSNPGEKKSSLLRLLLILAKTKYQLLFNALMAAFIFPLHSFFESQLKSRLVK